MKDTVVTLTKSESADERVRAIVEKTKLSEGVVRGVLGDVAGMKVSRESLGEIAERWGLQFGELARVKNMGRIAIADIRDVAVTKRVLVADKAMDVLMDRMSDPAELAEVKTRELAQIAKAMDDTALSLSNNCVGGGVNVNINIGDLRALKEAREERTRAPGLAERLAEAGVVIEAEAVETKQQATVGK